MRRMVINRRQPSKRCQFGQKLNHSPFLHLHQNFYLGVQMAAAVPPCMAVNSWTSMNCRRWLFLFRQKLKTSSSSQRWPRADGMRAQRQCFRFFVYKMADNYFLKWNFCQQIVLVDGRFPIGFDCFSDRDRFHTVAWRQQSPSCTAHILFEFFSRNEILHDFPRTIFGQIH